MRAALLAGAALALTMSALGIANELVMQLYDVTIETGLPHLEENLRYATRRENLCVGEKQLASLFPVLRHEALKGCRLEPNKREGSAAVFQLHCEGGSQTQGSARWQLERNTIYGTLDVKLGGKNMTFYQRITGRVKGACAAADQ